MKLTFILIMFSLTVTFKAQIERLTKTKGNWPGIHIWTMNFPITFIIQLIATAPGIAWLLETPTECKSACVVNTPIAPPKKCYIKKTVLSRDNQESKDCIGI